MPSIISTGGQTRTRNSYASSAQARLSLRVNGEEGGVVITPQGAVVQAGFDAPTATPTVASLGAGNVPVGYYVYVYVYASSRYPFVENAVTGGDGELWPRSNPSPFSAVFHVSATAKKVGVTVTYTTRSDVDWIWVYRTSVQDTSALAQAEADAGRFYYVTGAANDPIGGTAVIEDNAATDTGEKLEVDNYSCPLFWHTKFDGTYWWGWGNNTLAVVVTLAGGTTIEINSTYSPGAQWFPGRDGYTISFYGITTGGYDGRGNYYFQWLSNTTAQVFSSADMMTPSIPPATGYTTAYLSAPSTTLYRSKPLNPFSWGQTNQIVSAGEVINEPEEFAEPIGGGVGTAISLIPNERILKLDTESPECSYALDLNAAGSADFISTLRTLDEAQSVGSHFSQFPMRLTDGQSTGAGVNAKAMQLLSADAQAQIPIGSNVITTLRSMVRDGDESQFYHGAYDRNAELNCWWIKTLDGDERCDTLVYEHYPTGTWGLRYMPGISASWTVFDGDTDKYFTFVGTEEGYIGAAFYSDRYIDYGPLDFPTGQLTVSTGEEGSTLVVPIIGIVDTTTPTTADPTIATVAIGSYLGAAPVHGDLIQLTGTDTSLSDQPYTIFNVTDTTFQIKLPFAMDGPISGGAIVAPVGFVKCAVAQSGVGMFYITFASATEGSVLESAVSFQVTFSLQNIYDLSDAGTLPNSDPDTSYTIWVGGEPCYARRYYNASSPDTDKEASEYWTTMQNTDEDSVLLALYAEYSETASASSYVAMERDTQQTTSPSVRYFIKQDIDSNPQPCLGVETLELSDNAFKVLDMTLKQSNA